MAYTLRNVPITFPGISTVGMSGHMGIESFHVVLEGGRGWQNSSPQGSAAGFPQETHQASGQLEWLWRVLGLSISSLDLPLLIFAEVPVLHFPYFPGYRNRGVVESWPMTWKSDRGTVCFWEALFFADKMKTYTGPSFSLPPVWLLVWFLEFWN